MAMASARALLRGARAAALRPPRRLASSAAAAPPLAREVAEEGFAVVKSAVSTPLLADITRHFDWLRSTYPEIPTEHLHHPLVRRDPLWMHIATHPDLLEPVQAILGENVALFASHYICKEPQTGLEVLPHQDVWPLDPMEVVSIFVAVDECSSRNGGLSVLPRSHLPGLRAHRVDPGENVFGASLDADYTEPKALELSPGDAVFMHGNTVHSSAPNTSELRRAALTLRYIPVSTRVTNQARSTSYLWMAGGKPDPRINFYHSWPKYLEGYHPKFPGCESWNDSRRVNFLDEANFTGSAERQIEVGERRAREDVANVMETLAKGKRSAVAAEGKADRRFRASLWRSLESGPLEKMSQHPFVTGVRDGTVDEQSMRFYLEQDFHFLHQTGRAMKLLSARITTERAAQLLSRTAAALDPLKLEQHSAFEVAGLRWAELKAVEQAPYTRLYTDHLLAAAALDPAPSAFVSLLPCPFSYQRLFSAPEPDGSPALVLRTEPTTEAEKLCHAWVSYYSSEDYARGISAWEEVVDEVAADAAPMEQQAMLRAFDLSTRMEWKFWEMASEGLDDWGL